MGRVLRAELIIHRTPPTCRAMQRAICQIGVQRRGVGVRRHKPLCTASPRANKAIYQPFQVIYAANLQATADITTISTWPDYQTTRARLAPGKTAAGLVTLYKCNGTAGIKSITCVGYQLGPPARSVRVNRMGRKGNASNGVEFEVPAFCKRAASFALSKNAL